MNQLKFVEFNHANLNKPVMLLPSQVWVVYYSDASKSTHIVSIAGNLVPVRESVEEVTREVTKALAGERQDV